MIKVNAKQDFAVLERIAHIIEQERVREEHAELVTRLSKPAKDIRATMNDKFTTQLIAAMQLFIEAGQLLDLAKKQFFYNKEQKALQEDVGFLAACDTAEEYGFTETTDQVLAKLHMVVGIAGEASELLEGVVNGILVVRGDPIEIGKVDRTNEVEELGDLEFYLRGFRDAAGITRDETLRGNIDKLSKRYASGSYSDQQAVQRADKVDNAAPLSEIKVDNIGGGATYELNLQTGKVAPVPTGYFAPKSTHPYKASTYKEVFTALGDCWKRGCNGQDIVFAAAQWIHDTLNVESDKATQDRIVALIGAKLD